MTRIGLVLIIPLLLVCGCRQPYGTSAQNPWSPGSGLPGYSATLPTGVQGTAQYEQMVQQVQSLNTQLQQFNSDNDNLHTQVAALQQRLQNANNYNDQLRQQLASTVDKLQQSQQLANQPTSTWSTASGSGSISAQNAGATIRGNNGLMQNLDAVRMPGFKSWMDGDVIRIEGPTDRLFVSGTWQLNANDGATMSRLAAAIRQYFPRQVVGVEAHWDGSPVQPATTGHHKLTANQALAVVDLLVQSGLPGNQVFAMAMGSNRPRYQPGPAQNGISPNRRIEIVIYPETFQ